MIDGNDYIGYKPSLDMHVEPSISREKLIASLRAMRQEQAPAGNDMGYMYTLGRNVSIDLVLASIYCGDFDETTN